MTKLCKNCRYARRDLSDFIVMFGSYRFAKCMHSSALKGGRLNLATGEYQDAERYYADVMRQFHVQGDCGRDGQHWLPK